MKAKEIFEKLGFRQSFFGAKDNKCMIYDTENENTYVMFKSSTKEIKFCGSFKNKVDVVNFSMDIQLLQAINKQVEELGWLDER